MHVCLRRRSHVPTRSEAASAAALAAGRTRSVVKGYCCAAVSFCIRRRVFARAAVSGVRLANTLSPRCGYYAHIQSIWHNHHSHSLRYLSLGNSSWSVRVCAGVIEMELIWLSAGGCRWRPVLDKKTTLTHMSHEEN